MKKVLFLAMLLMALCSAAASAQTSGGGNNNEPPTLPKSDKVPVEEIEHPFEEIELPHSDVGTGGNGPVAYLNKGQGTLTISTGGKDVTPVINVYKDGVLVAPSVPGVVKAGGISTDVGQYGSGNYVVTVGDKNPLWCSFGL